MVGLYTEFKLRNQVLGFAHVDKYRIPAYFWLRGEDPFRRRHQSHGPGRVTTPSDRYRQLATRGQPAPKPCFHVLLLPPASAQGAAAALSGQAPVSSTVSARPQEPTRQPASSMRSARRLSPTCDPDPGRRGNGSSHQIGSWGNSIGFIQRRWCHNLAARPIAAVEE